jgi:hypothetical protein
MARALRSITLRRLAIATVLVMGAGYALAFLYAPEDADQGFIQKIFYLHVPLAIVALVGFIVAGLLAIQHLRTGESKWDLRMNRPTRVMRSSLDEAQRGLPSSSASLRMLRNLMTRMMSIVPDGALFDVNWPASVSPASSM